MLMRYCSFLIILSVILISGCADPDSSNKNLVQNAAKDDAAAGPALQPASVLTAAAETAKPPSGQISLRDAIAYALVNSPQLRSFAWDIHTTEANQMQAALRPNPNLQMQVSEFGGTDETHGFNSAESTLQVGQIIELAQKRSKRIHVASLEKQLAQWDYRAKRLDVISQVGGAFVDVLAAQEKLALSRELLLLTEQTHTAVAQRVGAGKDSPLKETKAKVAVSTMRIESQRAARALTSAKTRLGAAWGDHATAFEKVSGQFYEVAPVPEPSELTGLISQNPDMARWGTEKQKYRAAFDLEKAKATPDPTIKGGIKQFNEGDNTAFVVGLAIPLPIFDRNQAGIKRATYAIEKAAEQRKAAEINIHTALSQAAQSLATAFTEATVLASDVVPGAQSAFDAATDGYKAGKFDYLDVLDAQRTLFEARGQYVRSVAEYHKAKIDVERLIAQSLDSITDAQENK